MSAVGTDEGHECCADGPHDQAYVAERVRHSQKSWPQATLDHVKERAQVPTNSNYNKLYFHLRYYIEKNAKLHTSYFFLVEHKKLLSKDPNSVQTEDSPRLGK